MASTLKNILSKCQRSLGDEDFQRIQKGEWADFARSVVQDLATQVRLWLTELPITPFPVLTWTWDDETARLAEVVGPSDIDKIGLQTDTQQYYRLDDDTVPTWTAIDMNKVYIKPTLARIRRIHRVIRNNVVAREFSFQVPDRSIANGYAYSANNSDYTDGFAFAALRQSNDGTELHFSRVFDVGEEVRIHYSDEDPLQITRWDDTIEVADSISDAMEYGILTKAMERLYLQGDESLGNRLSLVERRKKETYREAAAYTRGFLDENSVPQTQPHIWLPE